jgi:CheY-like chemotaxis protein
VDDHPENNLFERQALEALGVAFDLVTSTDEALRKLRVRSYATIISDMSRSSSAEDDASAGLTLLRQVRELGVQVPFVIYAGHNIVTRRDELVRSGAFGVTNQPRELFDLVVTAIKSR